MYTLVSFPDLKGVWERDYTYVDLTLPPLYVNLKELSVIVMTFIEIVIVIPVVIVLPVL